MQVAGLSYEIDSRVDSPCLEDENSMFAGIEGERRVKNVQIKGEPLDSEKTYTLAATDYLLQDYGDGFSMFEGAEVLVSNLNRTAEGILYRVVSDEVPQQGTVHTVRPTMEDLYLYLMREKN